MNDLTLKLKKKTKKHILRIVYDVYSYVIGGSDKQNKRFSDERLI